ncbi:cyclic nucleotide-binding domain-containing protein, partial [Leptolyngbya sp. FACHB-36]|nr:cyclic nucleotide-binding domain-containing protein [Leptolyngbya sp. FACHB-36]
MTYTQTTPQTFLSEVAPFDQLSAAALATLATHVQPYRYRVGQTILMREKLPAQISILFDGQVRLLGYDPATQIPVTLRMLQSGDVLGAVGLVRGVACETAIASTETICLTLPAQTFLALLDREPAIAAYFRNQPALIEVFELLAVDLQRAA